jgi:uncharacterized membrane protein YbhN (UPF0104 family)
LEKSQARKIGFFAVKVLVAFLTIAILVRKISFERLLGAFSASKTEWMIAGIVLLLPNLFIQFAKWRLLVRQETEAATNRQILFSLLVGSALGLITPGRIGDFARSAFIRHADWARLVGLLMIDKLIMLAILYLFGIVGFAHFISMAMHPFIWLPILLMTVFIVALFMLFIQNPAWLRILLRQRILRFTRYAAVERLISGIELATPRLCIKLVVYSSLHLLTYCTQFVLFLFAFQRIRWLDALISTFAIMFTKTLIPVSLGDLGVRESASVYFFGQFGVSSAAAFNASFLLFCINVLIPAAMGMVVFMLKRRITAKNDAH